MLSLDLLLPTLQHFTFFGYWIVFLAAMLEALVIAGFFIPGTIIVLLAGFAAASGYLDIGDTIWFAAIGAFLGESISYWLGRRGTMIFRPENRILKLSYLERGKTFLQKYDGVSILFGRFVGPVSFVSPFAAGLFKMNRKKFYFWNILSAFVWAIVYVLLGYFFGQAWQVLATWSTRIGISVISIMVVLVLMYGLRRLVIYKGKHFLELLLSISRSIQRAIAANPDVRRFVDRHHRIFQFLHDRLTQQRFSGLPLTILVVIFLYALSLLFGLAEDVIRHDPIVAVDVRLAHLLTVFRNPQLVTVFLWITSFGKWQVTAMAVIATTATMWLQRQRYYVIPLLIVVFGSEIMTAIGKIALHRERPSGLVPAYTEVSFSFPSGHATIAVALYGFLAYYAWRQTKSWYWKVNILFASLAIILAIGFSRLYLGVHFLSDVLSGYLVGFLWLIAAIAIIEWRTAQAKRPTAARRKPFATTAIAAITVIGYSLFASIVVADIDLVPLQDETQSTAQVIALTDISQAFDIYSLPRFTETIIGNPQEPISIIMIAPNDETLIEVFSEAGWLQADQVSARSLYQTGKAAVLKQSYPRAPMTPSFWHSRVHDFGFEKPTDTHLVTQRHHVRFWKSNLETLDGNHVYIGTASFDTSLKWLVTHKIEPDIDTERDVLTQDLITTGAVVVNKKAQFVQPTLGKNFSGDQFFTDGKTYIIFVK